MTVHEIKEYLNNNSEDPEVKTLLDSISDKRVNQAISKLENKIPEMVELETQKRLELDNQRRQGLQRESEFTQGLKERLKFLNVSEKLGQALLNGLNADSSPEEIDQKFNEIESIQLDMVKNVESQLSGAREQLRNTPILETTEQQVLKNLGL